MHLVRTCCDNQVHVKRVDLHSQLCHFFWRYVRTCDWKMLGLWFELGLKHLLSRQLSRKHCCIFPASTTTSKTDFTVSCSQSQHLTSVSCSSFSRCSCPWFGPDNKGSDMFKHCIGPRVFTHWSAAFSKRRTRFAMFCEFQKNFAL